MLAYFNTITFFAGVWQGIAPSSSVPIGHQWAGAASASSAGAASAATSTVLTTSSSLPTAATSPATSGELTTSNTLSVHAGIFLDREITFEEFLQCMRPCPRVRIQFPNGMNPFTANYPFLLHGADYDGSPKWPMPDEHGAIHAYACKTFLTIIVGTNWSVMRSRMFGLYG